MGPWNDEQTWLLDYGSKGDDCSQGLCTLYCPQWCYVIYPPPPPPTLQNLPSGLSNFSPLVVVIIGILAVSFLLMAYYVLAFKCCRNLDSWRARASQRDPNVHRVEDGGFPSHQEHYWQVSSVGLDEEAISSIAACRYKKGDGFVEGTDCVVCLGEFREDESLRLLPKCSHAFHLPCIDTWLRSHSNCPLCRARVLPPVNISSVADHGVAPVERQSDDRVAVSATGDAHDLDLEGPDFKGEISNSDTSASFRFPSRAFSDLGGSASRSEIVLAVEDGCTLPMIRRSISMGPSSQTLDRAAFVSVFKRRRDCSCVGSKRRSILRNILSPITPMAMKRSYRHGRRLNEGNGALVRRRLRSAVGDSIIYMSP